MPYSFSMFKDELKRAEDWLSKEYSQLHTGRATPAFLDSISVESYGTSQPIKNVGSISVEDPKTLRISPWDKSIVKEIERSINAANLGVSVATDDKGLRVIFPALTAETRERLVKVLKQKLEDSRITVRRARDEELGKLKAAGLSEDELFRSKEELQKLVEVTNNDLGSLFERKEEEVRA